MLVSTFVVDITFLWRLSLVKSSLPPFFVKDFFFFFFKYKKTDKHLFRKQNHCSKTFFKISGKFLILAAPIRLLDSPCMDSSTTTILCKHLLSSHVRIHGDNYRFSLLFGFLPLPCSKISLCDAKAKVNQLSRVGNWWQCLEIHYSSYERLTVSFLCSLLQELV